MSPRSDDKMSGSKRAPVTVHNSDATHMPPSRSPKSKDTPGKVTSRAFINETREGHVRDAASKPEYDIDNDNDDESSDSQSPQLAPMDPVEHKLDKIIEILMCDTGGGMDIFRAWRDASDQPPITPDSLAELDMPRIINNPKLRHDVNFDRELHFRPNLDGSKGKEKIRAADKYWKALEGELFMLAAVQKALHEPGHMGQSEEHWESLMQESRKRLPRVFEVVRDILKTLVPDQDQQKIMDRLSVELLIQQIDHGMCDLVDLATWLAKVLKNHCAPMRDTMVDKMQKSIATGATSSEPSMMVTGLRQLLQILEAMKLDVANHQIRHMRPLLIGDTINFQQRYNAHRIALGKLNAESSRLWLEQERDYQVASEPLEATPTYLEVLATSLLRDLLFASSTTYLTPTFYLDIDRLRALRVDMHSMICHRICSDVLVELIAPSAPKSELPKALTALHTSLTAIVGTQGRWMENVENIATEIVRIVLMLEGRVPPFDTDLCAHAERRLQEDLAPISPAFCLHAQDMLERLSPKMKKSINAHSKLSALDLQDALVPPLPTTPVHSLGFGAVCEPVGVQKPTDPDTDIVRRFTHVVVLHWQVWADLVYLAPPETGCEDEADNDFFPRSPAPSASPEPVAQAFFQAGHKFLPSAVTTVDDPGLPTPAASPDPETDLQDSEFTDARSNYPDNAF